jgi:hypothetical protein
MYLDFKELLSVLNAHRVKYLVVGAYAVSIHAQQRATKGLDILVKADPDNAKAASRHWRSSERRFRVSPLPTSRNMARSFAWAVSRLVLTFLPRYPALSLMRHGRAGLSCEAGVWQTAGARRP